MKSKTLIMYFLFFAAATAIAQQPATSPAGARRGAGTTNLPSPLINADGTVTFRARAPDAKSVSLTSDFQDGSTDLNKGEDGVWSATVGPLQPDIYYYNLIIDGVRGLDPGNPQTKTGFTTSTITSILEVRAEKPAFYDIKDVPHGDVRTLLYNSKSNGVIRELNVYTPPGYDDNLQKHYPVVYLLHGANNDHFSWLRYGRANCILDNLLAERSIKPFIVVMPLGYGGASADGRRGASGARGGATGDLYEQDLLSDVIPLIDARFRTIANPKHRAIVGFSMGGGQSSRIGLSHLDTFGSIGVMSAGMSGGPDAEPLKSLAADPAAANKKIDLLWIACGKEDAAMAGAKNFANNLKQIAIERTFLETEGAHHWRVWRRYLRDLAPLLFRNDKDE
jgi:enterochelin esterase family protein